ncbi:hypothetical protein ACSDBR_07180 [Acidithiobacillus ferriphilus]|uniref:hypothetical protein n=1 Tax=Acidithiobacillus ferriphilus TaxID=1689834 RepID=UPI003F518F79
MIKYTVRYHYIFIWLGLLALLSPSGALAGDVYAKNGAPTYWNGRAEHKVYASLWKYISNNFLANYFYEGKLVNQVGSGLEVPGQPKKITNNVYMIHGYRNHDGSAQSAVIATGAGRVLLAAIGHELYQCASTAGSKPLMAVFVRDPNNLKYLPALKAWASSYCKKYTFHIYNLNCKVSKNQKRLITDCPLAASNNSKTLVKRR